MKRIRTISKQPAPPAAWVIRQGLFLDLIEKQLQGLADKIPRDKEESEFD